MFIQDLKFAIRTLARSRGFTATAVLCLSLGIGVNATVYSCVRAILLRPFPYGDPDGLVAIGEANPKRGWHMNSVSYPNFRSWQAENRTLSNVAIYSGNSFNLSTEDAAQYVQGGSVAWTMFRTLGVTPASGRDFREEDDRIGAAKVAIISDRLWREQFGGRPDAIDGTIMLNGAPHTVIGVMPPGFEFPGTALVWTTMQLDPARNRGNHSWNVIGRLNPGTTVEQAASDLRGVAARLEATYPNSNTGWSVDVQTLREFQTGSLRPVLLLMMAAVGFVLLIACANVANLLLARATARSREIAVRVALGASEGRIVRQLLTESAIISALGATLGIAIAAALLPWIKANVPGLPFWMRFEIDGNVLAFTAAVAVGTALLFGVMPAMHAASPNLNEDLRDAGGRGASAGTRRRRLRSALVVTEVALSVVLVVGATLLIRSFLSLQGTNPGFDTSHLLTMRLSLNGPAYDSTYKRHNYWERALTELNALPGVESASITNNIPLGGSNNNNTMNIDGQPAAIGSQPLLEIRWTSPKYLETLRVPMLSGRMFTPQEWADSGVAGRVAVINAYMATKFWGTADAAIGKRFSFNLPTDTAQRWYTIVGVAADIKHKRLNQDPDFQGYAPFRQGGWSSSTIVVRTHGNPAQAASAVSSALKKIDPSIPTYRTMTMDQNIALSYWQQTLYGKMFGGFAAVALFLAAIGVYGVISYTVSQRTREIGVRIALGAAKTDVLRLVLGEGIALGAAGVAMGLVGALAVTNLLRSQLIGVTPFDPATFAGVAVLLVGVALVASWVPAYRASVVNPIETLRAD